VNNLNNNTLPHISVLMSVRNAENSINFAIESILDQTYSNFEFLILDDYSTDNTYKILEKYQNIDNRIKLFNNDINLGLTRSLNILIKYSKGDFIARQDADDYSLPLRLEKQIEYIEKYKVDGCTTKTFFKNSIKTTPYLSRLLNKKLILLYKNPFIHGTLLINKEVLKNIGNYDESFYYAQDYKLMSDLVNSNKKVGILKRPLYILNTENNISTNKRAEQAYFAKCVQKKLNP